MFWAESLQAFNWQVALWHQNEAANRGASYKGRIAKLDETTAAKSEAHRRVPRVPQRLLLLPVAIRRRTLRSQPNELSLAVSWVALP